MKLSTNLALSSILLSVVSCVTALSASSSRPLALIVGVGDGLSASLARRFYKEGYNLVLAARDVEKLAPLASETKARALACDASEAADVARLFHQLKTKPSDCLQVVVYNPSRIVRRPIHRVDPERVQKSLQVTAFGSFLVAQQAAKMMLSQAERDISYDDNCSGTILFTGASAGIKGFARSAAFAMGKHAQKGLAESMARELHPQNIHVCWVNIDGAIRNPGRIESTQDSMLDPDAIAETYVQLIRQDRSAWSSELTLRPWTEKW